MKVYIVLISMSYEGDELDSVWMTEELADARVKAAYKERHRDYVFVDEREVEIAERKSA